MNNLVDKPVPKYNVVRFNYERNMESFGLDKAEVAMHQTLMVLTKERHLQTRKRRKRRTLSTIHGHHSETRACRHYPESTKELMDEKRGTMKTRAGRFTNAPEEKGRVRQQNRKIVNSSGVIIAGRHVMMRISEDGGLFYEKRRIGWKTLETVAEMLCNTSTTDRGKPSETRRLGCAIIKDTRWTEAHVMKHVKNRTRLKMPRNVFSLYKTKNMAIFSATLTDIIRWKDA